MIDRIRRWNQQRKMKKTMKVFSISPNSKGMIIFTYGMPEYMVSGKAVMKLRDEMRIHFAEKFPNYIVMFVPFYISLTGIVEESLE